ncbi:MAG: calcium/sodium antiporter [Haliscomenobacter sp.]|nr:calcium/sodium antiporter [Haliscomenobacter sp.]MBP9872569.1 calcium/sodium antiporter [Haliscomenobacter sp.]
MISILLLTGGVIAVLIGANFLVDGASSLAKKLQVSDLVIGLTVVAFGTSTPELTVSVFSSMQGEVDLALGNVVGSNLFNTMVILGIAAMIYPLQVHSNTIWKEIPMSLLAALVLLALVSDRWLDGAANPGISRAEGLALLGFFSIFLYYTFLVAKNTPPKELHNVVKTYPVYLSLLMVAGGLILLVVGGRWIVIGAVEIAERLGMSKSIIALTIVAAGTSIPELATSAVAAFKKNADIAVGNVVGSNIFNIFMILGVSAVIKPLGLGSITILDISLVAVISLVLFIKSYNYTVSRVEGGLLLLMYVAYVVYLILQS